MPQDSPDWRDRYPDEITCVRCLEVHDQMYLDRLLWCDRCRSLAKNRAGWWGWVIGLIFGALEASKLCDALDEPGSGQSDIQGCCCLEKERAVVDPRCRCRIGGG